MARELRKRGIDAITGAEAGRAGQRIPDQDQLGYATRQQRVMVTEDVHFRPRLPHGGLVLMQWSLSLGDYILYLEVLAEQFDPGDLAHQTHYCEW